MYFNSVIVYILKENQIQHIVLDDCVLVLPGDLHTKGVVFSLYGDPDFSLRTLNVSFSEKSDSIFSGDYTKLKNVQKKVRDIIENIKI